MAREELGHIKLVWTCPNCQTQNPGPQKICSGCGAPQPPDVKFEVPQHQELLNETDNTSQSKANPPSEADIHCGFCGARNIATAKICSQCGADLSQGTQRVSGQVIGAYQTSAVKQIPCPTCGVENPSNALNCSNCGSSLKTAAEKPESQQTPTTPKNTSPANSKNARILIPIMLLVIALCAVLFWVFSRTDTTSGIVQNVNWARSLSIQTYEPVTKQAWIADIPADGKVLGCEQKLHHTQSDEPAASPDQNLTFDKICGTPYIEDEGTGYGEVVQDCEYQVYLDYCQYEINDWVDSDSIVLNGSDLSPVWPAPQLDENQRVKSQNETYTIIFKSENQVYEYTTSDSVLFSQCTIGSEWILNINPTFNSVQSIEPAK